MINPVHPVILSKFFDGTLVIDDFLCALVASWPKNTKISLHGGAKPPPYKNPRNPRNPRFTLFFMSGGISSVVRRGRCDLHGLSGDFVCLILLIRLEHFLRHYCAYGRTDLRGCRKSFLSLFKGDRLPIAWISPFDNITIECYNTRSRYIRHYTHRHQVEQKTEIVCLGEMDTDRDQ